MLHEPAAVAQKEHAVEYKKRVGVWMFTIYAVVYAGFVAINLLFPKTMETTVLLGLNLAVVYGFGLILAAFVLAIIYNIMCMREERVQADADKGRN
jgi:uncharacterized membrane protein (DUF485 family)